MGITIRVLHDPPQEAPAVEGETILDNLINAGVSFSHDCRAGNCGSCKCELVEGDITELPYSEYALTPEEREKGIILACRAQAWGDCVVRPLQSDEVVLHPSRIMRCRVLAIKDATHDIKHVQLAIEAGGPYTFSAGQYAKILLAPGLEERSYSMANRPDESILDFHIRKVRNGQATTYLFANLKQGDQVRVSGPFGNAFLREAHTGPILAVAGGSGLAPIKSIVDTALQANPDREIHLYFGVRDERDVYLDDYFRELARCHPQVRTHVVLSEPSDPATPRRRGMVGDAVSADIPSIEGFKAYLAGPPPMVEHIQSFLTSRGLALRDIHADPFYSQAAPTV